MKQHNARIALLAAALGATGAAHAQSNVTIYGRIDVGLRHTTNANAAGDSNNEVVSGALSGSRLGFRGTEDLGNGMKAAFTIEQGFNPDTGTLAQSGKAWGRQAWVQLQTSLASITLGRQYSPVYVIEALNEPFGAYNTNEPGFIYDNYTGTPASGSGGNRWDNAVKLEATFAGLTLAGMVSAGEGATGTGSVGRKEGLSASYGQGPFTVNGAWQQTRNAARLKDHKVWTLGGTYAIGPAKLYLSYLDHKSDTSIQTNKVIALGASYAVTPAVDLVAGYYHDQQRDADGKKQLIAAMANYKLSKRTNIYLQADHGKLSGGYATNVFNQFAWPTGIDSRTTVTTGIRHVF